LRAIACLTDAKVSPTLQQRRGNSAVVDLPKEPKHREVHMKTASVTTASTPRPGTRNGALVDPEWLQDHLSDPRVRVVEVDVSAAAYDDWHIDGAVLWNIYADLKDADYRLRSTAALERLVARSGIDSDCTVVFYGYVPAWVCG
jgi:hypothetical protein